MEDFGILSLLPPALSLVLAVATRNVLVSLGLGVLLGMTIFNGFDPLAGVVDLVERGLFVQLSKPSNARVVVVIAAIGGFVGLLEASGGMRAMARRVTAYTRSRVSAQLAVWLMGMAVFFTDSGNSLILGPMFRPVFAGLRICKEKLAFIIDSTSSPVCVLVPVISWGVYVMSLIEQSYGPLGIDETSFSAFVGVLPFQFYPLLAIATVPVIVLTGREYGPMARAQQRTSLGDEGDPGAADGDESGGANASLKTVLVPLGSMLAILVAMFAYFWTTLGRLPASKLQVSLTTAYLAAACLAVWLLRREGVFTLKEALGVWVKGIERIVFVVIILILAWSLGDTCELLGTGRFIAGLFEGFLHPGFLPAMVFVLGGALSLSTGSSWGTFGLLMPIAIPVAHSLGAPMHVTIAAVLSGGMLGDHCSPVSDTTVLSSMSTGCRHADHVNTQLPYAMLTGMVALTAFLLAGFTDSGLTIVFAMIVQVVVVVTVARVFGVRSEDRDRAPELLESQAR